MNNENEAKLHVLKTKTASQQTGWKVLVVLMSLSFITGLAVGSVATMIIMMVLR